MESLPVDVEPQRRLYVHGWLLGARALRVPRWIRWIK